MFTGIDAKRYTQILGRSLIPFIGSCFPEDDRFQQDNDPKHCSEHVEKYFQDNGINWWRTPPESPNLNLIELVWGSLKQYLQNHCKPKTKQVAGRNFHLLADTNTCSMPTLHQPS